MSISFVSFSIERGQHNVWRAVNARTAGAHADTCTVETAVTDAMPRTAEDREGNEAAAGHSVDANPNNTSRPSLLCLAEGCGRSFSDRRGWVAHMAAKHSMHPPGSHKAVAEQRWVGAPLPPVCDSNRSQEGSRCPECFPLFVLTVDNDHYRERMRDTRIHLESCGFADPNEIVEIHMLDLADHPELKPRSVIMEGWKRHGSRPRKLVQRLPSLHRASVQARRQHTSSNITLSALVL